MWPVSGSPTGLPLETSHSRTVWSPPAEATLVPSGLNATLMMKAVWPMSGSRMGCHVRWLKAMRAFINASVACHSGVGVA